MASPKPAPLQEPGDPQASDSDDKDIPPDVRDRRQRIGLVHVQQLMRLNMNRT